VLPGDKVNRLSVLTNYISPKIYGSIADCTTYEQAIAALTALYVKPSNEFFARHCLATRRQKSGENLDEFLQALKILSKDCNFKGVTAARHREEATRDAFISGLQSSIIRQRLLENRTLDLATMFHQARALDAAHKNSELYSASVGQSVMAAVPEQNVKCEIAFPSDSQATSAAVDGMCFFVVILNISVQNAQLAMLYVISAIRKGIILKFVGHYRYPTALPQPRYIALL